MRDLGRLKDLNLFSAPSPVPPEKASGAATISITLKTKDKREIENFATVCYLQDDQLYNKHVAVVKSIFR